MCTGPSVGPRGADPTKAGTAVGTPVIVCTALATSSIYTPGNVGVTGMSGPSVVTLGSSVGRCCHRGVTVRLARGDTRVMVAHDGAPMSDLRPTAVLVVTTLPGGAAVRVRVLSTSDVEDGAETTVVVQSLTELQGVVAAWWTQSWEHAAL